MSWHGEALRKQQPLLLMLILVSSYDPNRAPGFDVLTEAGGIHVSISSVSSLKRCAVSLHQHHSNHQESFFFFQAHLHPCQWVYLPPSIWFGAKSCLCLFQPPRSDVKWQVVRSTIHCGRMCHYTGTQLFSVLSCCCVWKDSGVQPVNEDQGGHRNHGHSWGSWHTCKTKPAADANKI